MQMNKRLIHLITLCSGLLITAVAFAAPSEFSIGVLAYPFRTSSDESLLRSAINASDADNLAFVVANGIKSEEEPCSDSLYTRRKRILNSAQNGLVLSLVANDWASCKKDSGRSAAIERLNRIRELFFVDEFSFGASKIPLLRQSSSPKFRSYVENAHWEINGILFATINLPSNNNNYLAAAGRNSEFEDRLIANHAWLQRIAVYASLKKLRGIVLFCDGNPLATPSNQSGQRDGFLEVRRQLSALSAKFTGKMLIVHSDASSTAAGAMSAIRWRGNLGEIGVAAGWTKLTISPTKAMLFSTSGNPIEAKISRR
jgi:hypothetical protein